MHTGVGERTRFAALGANRHTGRVTSPSADFRSASRSSVWLAAALCALAGGCGSLIRVDLDEGVTDQGVDAYLPDQGEADGSVPIDDQGPDSARPDLGGGILLEVGYGPSDSFMVAPGSGTATAVMGIQGGYHLDMGFRVRGLSAADFNSGSWVITYEFRTAAGQVLSEPISRVLSLVGVSFDGTGQVRSGDRVFFLSNDPSPFNNAAITLMVTLSSGTRVIESTADMRLQVP